MPKFGVNFIADTYYEVEAEDFDSAIEAAYELLYHENLYALEWDCNEVIDLDE